MKQPSLAPFMSSSSNGNAGPQAPRIVIVCLLVAIGFMFLYPVVLVAKTPDGQPPSEESVCDDQSGRAYGLCNAYCEATDCGDGVNYANFRACERLQSNWEKATGVAELPCDCEDSETYVAGEGCTCAYDLVIQITDFRPLGCPNGQGTCTYEMDIEVKNQGSLDITDPFSALVELPGVGLGNSELFPAGLGAGVSESRLNIPLGPGDNCFDPNCEIFATADPGDRIDECDETNNRDFLEIQG